MKPAKAIEILRGSTDMVMMPEAMKEAIRTVCNERDGLREACESLRECAESYQRVIAKADPAANSTITKGNAAVKVLADWGRMLCDMIESALAAQPEGEKEVD